MNKEKILDNIALGIVYTLCGVLLIVSSPVILVLSPFLLLIWAINRVEGIS